MRARPLQLLAAAAVSLLLGCSDQPETTAPEPKPIPKSFGEGIQKELARIRALPRPGILGEESRYSLFEEEVIIRDFFQDRREGFFVDVGCAWAIKANNTYYLEKHLGWTGIGVDALGEYAEGWAQHRPGSRFFQFLVTDRSGSDQPFYRSAEPGLSSTTRQKARGLRFGANLEVEEILVPSVTLDELLEEVGVSHVDLLAMDIEGHELLALRGIDLDRYRPELIVVEGNRGPVLSYLAEQGYEVIERYRPYDRVNSYLRRSDAPTDERAQTERIDTPATPGAP